jgi:hypothetical protein
MESKSLSILDGKIRLKAPKAIASIPIQRAKSLNPRVASINLSGRIPVELKQDNTRNIPAARHKSPRILINLNSNLRRTHKN